MRILTVAAAAALMSLPAMAPAMAQVSTRSFEPTTAGEFATLCNTATTDPNYAEAMGFCRGMARGAWEYHREITTSNAPRVACPPSPLPPDGELRAQFLAWTKANARNAAQRPVEGLFRFLSTTFPCPR